MYYVSATVQRVQGSACFPESLQNFSESQILWSFSLVVFHASTLKLPIQNSLIHFLWCLSSKFVYVQEKNVKYSGKQAHSRSHRESSAFRRAHSWRALVQITIELK